ncbi:hypothetical protein EC991_009075 [Linnemannia zychae]|nr:hypothetical protein EC991_009075 [Linnemannia zychae]
MVFKATTSMNLAAFFIILLLGVSTITHAAPVPVSLTDAALYHSGLAAGHTLGRLPDPVVQGGLDGDRGVSEGQPPRYDHTRHTADALLYNTGEVIGVVAPGIAPKTFRDGGIGGAKEVSGFD